LFFGCATGIFYNHTVNAIHGYGLTGIGYGVIISALLLSLQGMMSMRFLRYEEKLLGV
jgi:hypothetical protein